MFNLRKFYFLSGNLALSSIDAFSILIEWLFSSLLSQLLNFTQLGRDRSVSCGAHAARGRE